jgi:hypothetical protein
MFLKRSGEARPHFGGGATPPRKPTLAWGVCQMSFATILSVIAAATAVVMILIVSPI